jgi:hypothetical protein
MWIKYALVFKIRKFQVTEYNAVENLGSHGSEY